MPGKKLSIFFIILLLVLFISCTQQDSGKMPITSNSEEAKKQFLTGLELFEKLRIQESLEYFEKAIENDPDFGLAYFYFSQAQPTAKGFFEQLDQALLCLDKISESVRRMVVLQHVVTNLFHHICYQQ